MSNSRKKWNASEVDDHDAGWLLAEAQILYALFWGSSMEVPPKFLNRYADKSRQLPDPSRLTGLESALQWANNLYGLPGDFPLQNGVNLDITTQKWDALDDDEQLDLFTRMRDMPESDRPPTREAFELAGIRMIDDFV